MYSRFSLHSHSFVCLLPIVGAPLSLATLFAYFSSAFFFNFHLAFVFVLFLLLMLILLLVSVCVLFAFFFDRLEAKCRRENLLLNR